MWQRDGFSPTRLLVALGEALGRIIVAEGVETLEEYATLRGCGIDLMLGHLLAKPAFERLPPFTIPCSIPSAPAA